MRGLFLAAGALLLSTTPLAAQSPLPIEARLDSVFARYLAPGSPGCALGVARDGRIIMERAWGLADVERGIPLTPAAIFEAGSVTKQFTAAAILLLANEGRLSLDDDVRRHMPELPDYGATVTIRQLINHTSGMRDWGSISALAGWPRDSRALTNAHVLEIITRLRELNFPPGSEYDYSNTNYNLLAMIVERISGRTFPAFTQERLFAPLGMTRSSWRDDATRLVPGRAPSYTPAGSGWRAARTIESIYGNCCLLTTVGDLLRWNTGLDSARLGGPWFRAEQERRGVLTGGRQISYASGVEVHDYRGLPVVDHGGATAGYRAYLTRFPSQRLSVAVLCNAGNANPGQLAYEAAARFIAIPPAPSPQAPVAVSVPAGAIADKAGLYRNARNMGAQRFVVRNGALQTEAGLALIPQGPTVFTAATGGNQVHFDRRPDGRYDLRLVTPDGDTVPAIGVAEADTSRAALAAFAGTWFSPEAEATWRITQEPNGSLMLRRAPSLAVPLRPVYRDGFSSPFGVLVFNRDASGRLAELRFTTGRVRNLRFGRTAAAQ